MRRRAARREVDIVIIGAGATGVELAAEIRQTTRAHAAYGLDHIDPARDIRITLLEAFSRVLPPLSDHVADGGHGAPCRSSTSTSAPAQRVTEIDADGVHTASGDFYPSDLIVWAAGIMAPAVQRELDGLEVNRANQLVVGPDAADDARSGHLRVRRLAPQRRGSARRKGRSCRRARRSRISRPRCW